MCRNALVWRGVGLFALVLLLVGAPNAYGDVVWQTTANSSWDTVTNWTATLGEALPPDAADVVVDFSTLEITSDVIVTLDDSGDGTRTVGTLKFGDTSASNNWIINAGTAGSITLATSIGTPTIEVVNQTATINAVVAGTQGFAKTGAGTLVLGNTANTFTGTVALNAGVLSVGAVGALGDASNTIEFDGGTLRTTATIDLGTGHAITIGASGGTLSAQNDTTLTVPGTLSGSGLLTAAGGGTIVLSADNSDFTGNVIVDSVSGNIKNTTLRLSNANAITSGTITVNPGVAEVNGNGNQVDLANVSIGSGVSLVLNATNSSSARSSLFASTGTSTWNGGIQFNGDGPIGLNAAGGATLTIAGDISGGYTGNAFIRGEGTGAINGTINLPSGSIYKTDGGTWTINSTGNVWVNTKVAVGTLKMGIANALPSTTALTMGQNDTKVATLDLNGFDQTIASLASDPTAVGGNTTGKTVTSATAATLTIDGSANTTYAGNITGALSIIKNGTGSQVFGGATSYTGTTTVNAGTLVLGSTPANFATPGNISVVAGSTLGVQVGGTGHWTAANIDTLVGVTPDIFPTGTNLGIDVTTGTFIYGSVITGPKGLVKLGTGALTLTAANNYSGNTIINRGLINVNNSSALSSGTVTVAGAGRMLLADGVNMANDVLINVSDAGSGLGVIQGPATGSATLSGTITVAVDSATGGHLVGGTGLVIAGPMVQAGTTTYIQIRDGLVTLANAVGNDYTTLRIASSTTTLAVNDAIDTDATVYLATAGTATLNLNNFNQTLAGLYFGADSTTTASGTVNMGTGALTLNGNVTSFGTGSHTINGNLSLGGGTRTFDVADGTSNRDLFVNAIISSGALIKDGAGTLDLGAANTFAGGVTLKTGTLRVANNAALGTGALTVDAAAANPTLASASDAAYTLANNLVLNADATFGQAAVGTGILTVSGTVNLVTGAPRTLTVHNNTVLAGVVSNGALKKAGAGTLDLTAANTYTGGTDLSEGILRVGHSGALGSGTLTVSGWNATLATVDAAPQNVSNALAINADVNFGQLVGGIGPLTLSGATDLGSTTRTLTVLNTTTFSGPVSNGSITKAGAGTLNLTGSNTLGTDVSVTAGALYANAPAALSGATTISVSDDAAFLYGAGGGTTLTVSNLYANYGSTVGFGLGFTTGPSPVQTTDKIAVSGSASAYGALISGWAMPGFAPAQTYTLMTAPSGLDNVTLGYLPAGYTYSLAATAGQVDLTVTGVAPGGAYYWTGDNGTSSWATLLTGANSNWSTLAGGTADPQAIPAAATDVIFSASNASGSAFTTTLDGPFSINSLKFIGTTPATGAVTIASGGIGTLTIGAGGLELDPAAPLPVISAPVAVNVDQRWTINNATATNGVQLTGPLAGSGTLTKVGNARLTLGDSVAGSVASSFSGTIRLVEGQIVAWATTPAGGVSGPVVNPLGTATIQLLGGTFYPRPIGDSNTTNRDYYFDNELIIDGNATVDLNRVSGSAAENKNAVFSSLTINNSQLTIAQNVGHRLAISGNINLVGSAVINSGDVTNMASGKITDNGQGLTLNKVGGSTLNVLGTGNDYSGGTVVSSSGGVLRVGSGYGTSATNFTATAGTGPIVVNPGARAAFNKATNIAAGQTIDLVSNAANLAVIETDGDFLALSSIRTLTGGLLQVGDTVTQALDQSRLGDGTWRLATSQTLGSGTIAAGATIQPGAGNLFRVGGGNHTNTLTISATNYFTGSAGLEAGAPFVNGSILGGVSSSGNSAVLLASTNTYSGATTVQRGTTLRFRRGGTGGSSFGTTSGIGVYGTITAESSGSNHGTFFNSAGAVIPVTLYGGAKIFFDNAAITTANAQVDRWDDNTPMAWNQLDLEMKSRDVAAADVTTETVGDVTFTGGNILRLTRGDTNSGNKTRFVVDSLTRVNGGTIEITRSSALGGADQFAVTNDAPSPWFAMTTPWIVNHSDKSHVTYSAPNGFANVAYSPTATLDNAVSGEDLVNTAAKTLTINPVLYALKQTGGITTGGTGKDTVTIGSGGLIADFASTSATNSAKLKFNDGTNNVEAVIFVDDNDTLVQSGTVTAAGLTKFGSGVLRLTADNSTTLTAGSVYVNRGTLQLDNAKAVNNLPIYVSAGTLSLRGSDAAAFSNEVTLRANQPLATLNVGRSSGSNTNRAITIPKLTLAGSDGAVGQTAVLTGDNDFDLLVSGMTTVTGHATFYANTGSTAFYLDGGLTSNTAGAVLTKAGGQLVRVAGTGNAAANTQFQINGGTLELRNTGTSDGAFNPVGAGANVTIVANTGTLNLRSNDKNGTFGGTSATAGGYNVVVNGDATINADRTSSTSGSNKRLRLGGLTIGSQTLTLSASNGYQIGFNGPVVMNGDPTFNCTADIPDFNGAVSGGRLIKTGAAALRLWAGDNVNSYDGGSIVNQGWLVGGNNRALGTGDIVVNPGGGVAVNKPTTLQTGQIISLRSNTLGLGMVAMNYATSVAPSALLPNLDLTHAAAGIFGGGSNYTVSLDMNDLFGGGEDDWYLGAVAWNDTNYRADAFAPGAGSTYRLGGGGGNMQINRNNATPNTGIPGTDANNLLTGTASVTIGLPAHNLRANSASTVVIAGTHDYTEGTLIHRGMTLHLASPADATTSGAGTGNIDIYGTLVLRTAGTLTNGSGGNVNAVTTHPGARILLNSDESNVGMNKVTVGDRWGDAAAVHLNGARFDVAGQNRADDIVNEVIGAVTFERGAQLRVDLNGSGASRTYLTMASLTRTGSGTLMLQQGNGVLPDQTNTNTAERFIVTATGAATTPTSGMVPPWIVDASSHDFVTYNATTSGAGPIGFQTINYDKTISTGTYTGGSLLATDKVSVTTGALTLTDDPTVYALRVNQSVNTSGTFDTITIRSGGFIGAGGTTSANLVFNNGSANIEALMYTSSNTVLKGTVTASQITKFGLSELHLDRVTPVFNGPIVVNSGILRAFQLAALGTGSITLNGGGAAIGESGDGPGIVFDYNPTSVEQAVYTHGDVTSWDNNRIIFGDIGSANRSIRVGNFTLKSTSTAADALSVLQFRMDNSRSRYEVASITIDSPQAILNIGYNNASGWSSVVAPSALVGSAKTVTKLGNGILELDGLTANLSNSDLIIGQGGLRVVNGAALGTDNRVVIDQGAALIIGGSNLTLAGTTTLTQKWGSAERWEVENARTGNYTLPAGVSLQLATNLLPTTARTITLDGGSIEGFLYNDSIAKAVFRTVGNNVTINLASNSFIGQNTDVGNNGPDAGMQGLYPDRNPVTGEVRGAILVVEGAITGSGSDLTKIGRDAVVLAGANSYRNTIVEQGILRLGATDTLPTAGVLTPRFDGIVDLNGFNQTVAALGTKDEGPSTSAGLGVGYSGTITTSAYDHSTLTVSNADNYTYNGDIVGNLNIVKNGAGELNRLGGSTSYTGTTVVNGGLLHLSTAPTLLAAAGANQTIVADGAGIVIPAGGPNQLDAAGVEAFRANALLGSDLIIGFDVGDAGSYTYGTLFANASGFIKAGTGTIVLPVASAWPRGISLRGGTTEFVAGALGTTETIELQNSNTIRWSGTNTEDLSVRLSALPGDATMTFDVGTNDITFGTALVGSPTTNLVKAGSGKLTLDAAATYGGYTNINAGTLEVNVANSLSATGLLTLGSGTTPGSLVVNADQTVAGLVNPVNSATASTITVADGTTLLVTGGMSVGVSPLADGKTTKLVIDGAGALHVDNATATIDIGMPNTDQNNAQNVTTVDMTALGSFIANVDDFRIGWDSKNAATLLASNTSNSITATRLRVGNTNGDNAGSPIAMVLGAGANVINADTIEIGLAKATASIAFASQAPGSPGTVVIGNKAGTGGANITVGAHTNAGTSATLTATLDLRGHLSTVVADNVVVGFGDNNNGTGTASGVISFDTGTFAANTLSLGTETINGTGTNTATAVLNIGGGAFTVSGATTIATNNATTGGGNITGTINLTNGSFSTGSIAASAKTAASTGAATTNINVSGGSFTVNPGGSFTLASQATAGTAVGTLNLTGGTFTSNADIVDGGGATTTKITLNGGTLDMTGKAIGYSGSTGTPIDTLEFQAGTLKNVAAINGTAGLTKTTPGTLLLDGVNTYTGDTYVEEGILQVSAGASSDNTAASTTVNDAAGVGTAQLITEHVRQDTLTINANGTVTIDTAGGASGASVVNFLQSSNGADFAGSAGGSGLVPAGVSGAGGIASPVPEPATWLLVVMAALAGLAAWRRRR